MLDVASERAEQLIHAGKSDAIIEAGTGISLPDIIGLRASAATLHVGKGASVVPWARRS